MAEVRLMSDLRTRFLEVALWHGPLDEAREMLAAHPELAAGDDIHIAAVLGDGDVIQRLLRADPALVRRTSPPYGGDPLTYLALSRFLRLDPSRSDAFVRSALALLDAGADPNGGFWTSGTPPERETALYGAAGVAHHPGVTALLLERGADPNDEEVVYHSPEGDDSRAMRLVVETGRVVPGNLALMLVRKADWHDLEGARYLLEQGADPNHRWTARGLPALHHAIQRDNISDTIAIMLDYGGDPTIVYDGRTAVERAARRGRPDLLALFEARRFRVTLPPDADLLAACARDDREGIARLLRDAPKARGQVVAEGAAPLTEFAGTGNGAGIERLLELGVPVDASYPGDGYWELAPGTTALHNAAWRLREVALRVLLAAGAEVNARDARGRTPLQMTVRACTTSYWSYRRSPGIAAALLAAGASREGITTPTGYAALDALLDAS